MGSVSYNGNPRLKRSNVQIFWTEEMIEEYIKCSRDPVYFIENYMKIVHVDEGLIGFNLYDYQHEMVKSMADNRFTIITTARQTGKSTTTCGYLLWYILFNDMKTVGLLANKGDTAREILGRVQLAYEHLPQWLQQGVVEYNKGSFELENGSRILAAATSSSAIRGYSLSTLFVDEAAFIDNWDEFFTSVYPTISSGKHTKIILVSTPNGLNHFHKLWEDACAGRNSFNPIQVMWHQVPGRDDAWKEETVRNTSYEQFLQEHCCEFLGASNTLVNGQTIKNLVHKEPLYDRQGLRQYEEPIEDHVYTMIVDVSRGKGLDYSAVQVIDITQMPYNQVAVYHDNLTTPIDLAGVCSRLGHIYNEAFILVEINDIGEEVANLLHYDHEYENLVFTAGAGRAGKKISGGFGKNVDKGIRTTKSVKTVGCSMIKMLIEQQQFIINDHSTIQEISVFSKKGSSFEAEPGHHDDLMMCLVLFGWMSNQTYFKELTDLDTVNRLKEKREEDLFNDLPPMPIISDGVEEAEAEEINKGQWWQGVV